MTEEDAYSWYDGQPNSDISQEDKKDYRDLPVCYPQITGERDMCTACGVMRIHRSEEQWAQCKWGVKASHFNHCLYLRFGFMCDKIVDKDGKGVN